MTRRTISQIVVFILLCVPLLSLVGFLVYTVIPNSALIVVHPVSCAVFLAFGLYGASLLRERGVWANAWYCISIILMFVVGIWGIGAYLFGYRAPFVLHNVELATGSMVLFVLQAWTLLLFPYKTRAIRFLQGFVVIVGLYLYLAPFFTPGVTLWYLPLPFSSLVLFVCIATLVALGESSHIEKPRVPIVVLVVSTILTGAIGSIVAWKIVSVQTKAQEQRRFVQQVVQEARATQQVVDTYVQRAQQLQTLIQEKQPLAESSWQQIVSSIDTTEYPAIASISYIPRTIDTQNQYKERFEIQYATSFRDGVQAAVGFDISSDPVRSEIIRSALAARTISATPVMEDTKMFSLYIPLYAQGEPSGIVAVSFATNAFLSELTSELSYDRTTRIALADTVRTIYQEPIHTPTYVRQETLFVGGTMWKLSFSEIGGAYMMLPDNVLRVGAVGTVFAAIVVGGVVGLKRRRTKARKGVFVIHPRAVSILPMLESLIKEYESLFKQKKQRFEVSLPKRIPPTLVDPTVVRVALETVLRNAYRLAPIKGDIRFAAEVTTIKRVAHMVHISCVCHTQNDAHEIQQELSKKSSAYLARLNVETLYRAQRMFTLLGSSISSMVREGEIVVTLSLPVLVSEEPKAL